MMAVPNAGTAFCRIFPFVLHNILRRDIDKPYMI